MASAAGLDGLTGNTVCRFSGADLVSTGAQGFSTLGTWTVVITDEPAVHIHDTGGLLGEEITCSCTDPAQIDLSFTGKSRRLSCRAPMDGGRRLSFVTTRDLSNDKAAALMDLGRKLDPEGDGADVWTPLPISVDLIREGAEDEEITATLSVVAGRLFVDKVSAIGRKRLLDIPTAGLSAANQGNRVVEITAGAVLHGKLLKSLQAHVPVSNLRKDLVRAMGTPDTTGERLMDTVKLTGSGETREVECLLQQDAIVLAEKSTPEKIAHIDLSDPEVRVSGSASAFVLWTPVTGALAITDASDLFGQRLAGHPRLTEIARDTVQNGPYPCLTGDGRPALARIGDEGWSLEWAGGEQRAAFADTGVGDLRVQPSRARIELKANDTTSRLIAQADVAEVLQTALRAGKLRSRAQPVTDLLHAIVGLEEDWLLDAIAGPVCLVHHGLLTGAHANDSRARPALGERLDPDSTPDALAPLLAAGLDQLKRHFDMVVNVLPAFIGHCDARVASTGDTLPGWLKPNEAATRAALAQTGRALSEAIQMRGQLGRIAEFDPSNLPKPDYTSAALASVVGGALNPVLALGGISQAIQTYQAGETRSRMAEASGQRVWRQVLGEWNAFATELLPVICYNVTESLFPLRWDVSRKIAEAHEMAEPHHRAVIGANIARRLAILDVRRRYPAEPGAVLTRDAVATYIRRARDAVHYPRFTSF